MRMALPIYLVSIAVSACATTSGAAASVAAVSVEGAAEQLTRAPLTASHSNGNSIRRSTNQFFWLLGEDECNSWCESDGTYCSTMCQAAGGECDGTSAGHIQSLASAQELARAAGATCTTFVPDVDWADGSGLCEYVRNAGNDHKCATCSRYGKAGYGSNAWEVFRVFKCTKPATPGTTTTQAVATTTVPATTARSEAPLQTWTFPLDGFRDGSSTAVVSTGANNGQLTATIHKGASFGPGRDADEGGATKALVLDGVGATPSDGQHMSINGGITVGGGAFSLCAWTKWSTITAWERFADIANGASSNNIGFHASTTPGILIWYILRDGSSKYLAIRDILKVNTWMHICGTVEDSGTMHVYVDGEEQPCAAGSGACDASTGRGSNGWTPKRLHRKNAFFGRSNWNNPYFKGSISDIMLVDGKALTAADISKTLFNSLQVSGACSTLSSLNAVFSFKGRTADGKGFYLSKDGRMHLFYDKSCDGSRNVGKWIFKDFKGREPSTTADEDLDGDGKCIFAGRINSDGSSLEPPKNTNTWRLSCDRAWTNVDLVITNLGGGGGSGGDDLVSTTTATSTTITTATSTGTSTTATVTISSTTVSTTSTTTTSVTTAAATSITIIDTTTTESTSTRTTLSSTTGTISSTTTVSRTTTTYTSTTTSSTTTHTSTPISSTTTHTSTTTLAAKEALSKSDPGNDVNADQKSSNVARALGASVASVTIVLAIAAAYFLFKKRRRGDNWILRYDTTEVGNVYAHGPLVHEHSFGSSSAGVPRNNHSNSKIGGGPTETERKGSAVSFVAAIATQPRRSSQRNICGIKTSNGLCRNAADLPQSQMCREHTCKHPTCTTSKSSSAQYCKDHNHHIVHGRPTKMPSVDQLYGHMLQTAEKVKEEKYSVLEGHKKLSPAQQAAARRAAEKKLAEHKKEYDKLYKSYQSRAKGSIDELEKIHGNIQCSLMDSAEICQPNLKGETQTSRKYMQGLIRTFKEDGPTMVRIKTALSTIVGLVGKDSLQLNIGPSKREERVLQKANNYQDPTSKTTNYGRILDYGRAELILKDLTKLPQVVRLISQSPDFKIVRAKNRFSPEWDSASSAGYRDYQIILKTAVDGWLVEVQIIAEEMHALKGRLGHANYEEYRFKLEILKYDAAKSTLMQSLPDLDALAAGTKNNSTYENPSAVHSIGSCVDDDDCASDGPDISGPVKGSYFGNTGVDGSDDGSDDGSGDGSDDGSDDDSGDGSDDGSDDDANGFSSDSNDEQDV